MSQSRLDLEHIASLVEPGSRVLDVGCGDGDLLALLKETRNADARGLEISREGVTKSVARGLSVVQGDAESDLPDYPDNAFDYVILTRTIQAMTRPDQVLEQALRIGNRAIVSFPNCGFWTARMSLGIGGRMPHSRALPVAWYKTDNIHLCTILDFMDMCSDVPGLNMDQAFATGRDRQAKAFSFLKPAIWWTNLTAEEAIFVLRRG